MIRRNKKRPHQNVYTATGKLKLIIIQYFWLTFASFLWNKLPGVLQDDCFFRICIEITRRKPDKPTASFNRHKALNIKCKYFVCNQTPSKLKRQFFWLQSIDSVFIPQFPFRWSRRATFVANDIQTVNESKLWSFAFDRTTHLGVNI